MAITSAFFALFGFIFLITQYFQFVRGYGTLSTGARILPVALSIAVASVVGAVLAPRIGTKVVVSTGLLLFGASFVWISTVAVDASYATTIVPQMVLMGLGMGLISTPATESILLVLPPARAGVGSAVNDATRILGGTLGVAVIGSIYASLYASQLSTALTVQLPQAAASAANRSVGGAFGAATQLDAIGQTGLARTLRDAASTAFFHGFSTACLVAAAVSAVGAVLAGILIPAQPPRPDEARVAADRVVGEPAVARGDAS